MTNKDDLICGCKVLSISVSTHRNEENEVVQEEPILEVLNVYTNHIFTITLEGFCSLAEISKEEFARKVFTNKYK